MTKKVEKPRGREDNAKIIPVLNEGYDKLDKSLDMLIKAVDEQKLELLSDALKLALKLSHIYRVAHLAQLSEGGIEDAK